MSSNVIRVVGARVHNLKNITVEIPRDKFVVITGLSGSATIKEQESSGPGFWSSTWGVLWRMLVVLAAVAVAPFAAWPAAKFVFSRDSNWANGVLLLALTLLDVAVLFATVGFELSTAVVICALVLLPVAGFVNLRVLNAIEERG